MPQMIGNVSYPDSLLTNLKVITLSNGEVVGEKTGFTSITTALEYAAWETLHHTGNLKFALQF